MLRAREIALRLNNAQRSVLPTVRFVQHASTPENFGADADVLKPLGQRYYYDVAVLEPRANFG
eukprot:1884763-Alexandrium_andersonii.AAC.1